MGKVSNGTIASLTVVTYFAVEEMYQREIPDNFLADDRAVLFHLLVIGLVVLAVLVLPQQWVVKPLGSNDGEGPRAGYPSKDL